MRYSIDGYNYLFRRFHRNRRLQNQLKAYREKLTECLHEESIEKSNDKNNVIDLDEINHVQDLKEPVDSNESEHCTINIKEPIEPNESEHYIVDIKDPTDNIIETIERKLNDLKNQLEGLEPYLQEKYINELQNELKDLKNYVELRKNEIENECKEEPVLYQKVLDSIRNQIYIDKPEEENLEENQEEHLEENLEKPLCSPTVILHEEKKKKKKKKTKKKNFKIY